MRPVKSQKTLEEEWADWAGKAIDFAKAHGINQAKIAEEFGWSDSAVSKLRNPPGTTKGRALRAWEAAKLSQICQYPLPADLIIANSGIMSDFIPLRLGVAAGSWHEGNKDVSPEKLLVRQFETKPEFAGLQQYARPVNDTHADLYVPRDFYLLCVDYRDARKALAAGDKVTLERVRHVDDRAVFELTVRIIVKRNGSWFLDPVCSEPSRFNLAPIPYEGDTDALRICDLIISRYAPD